MTDTAPHSVPGLGSVLPTQMKSTLLALRWEIYLFLGLLGLATVLVVRDIVDGHGKVSFDLDGNVPLTLLGFLAGFLLWRREKPFELQHMWLMPMNRRVLALTKVMIGWALLMTVVGILMGWIAVMALLSGGPIGVQEVRLVFDGGLNALIEAPVALESLRRVDWTTPAWQWLVPFVGATILYLLANAAVLGLKHPVRWLLGGLVCALLLPVIKPDPQLIRFMGQIFVGEFGLNMALTASASGQPLSVSTTVEGQDVLVWTTLPSLGPWLKATMLWLVGSAGLVVAATFRQRA